MEIYVSMSDLYVFNFRFLSSFMRVLGEDTYLILLRVTIYRGKRSGRFFVFCSVHNESKHSLGFRIAWNKTKVSQDWGDVLVEVFVKEIRNVIFI